MILKRNGEDEKMYMKKSDSVIEVTVAEGEINYDLLIESLANVFVSSIKNAPNKMLERR